MNGQADDCRRNAASRKVGLALPSVFAFAGIFFFVLMPSTVFVRYLKPGCCRQLISHTAASLTDWVSSLAAVATVLVSVFAVALLYLTLRSTERAVLAAARSNELLAVQLRPWTGITDVEIENATRFTTTSQELPPGVPAVRVVGHVAFVNSGHTPAISVTPNVHIAIYDADDDPPTMHDDLEAQRKRTSENRGVTIAPNDKFDYRFTRIVPLGLNSNASAVFVVVTASATYFDTTRSIIYETVSMFAGAREPAVPTEGPVPIPMDELDNGFDDFRIRTGGSQRMT